MSAEDRHLYRYQFQPWHVRLWRMRWLLLVPLWWIVMLATGAWAEDGDSFSERLSLTWTIAVAHAHMRMEYWYTLEEADEIRRLR